MDSPDFRSSLFMRLLAFLAATMLLALAHGDEDRPSPPPPASASTPTAPTD